MEGLDLVPVHDGVTVAAQVAEIFLAWGKIPLTSVKRWIVVLRWQQTTILRNDRKDIHDESTHEYHDTMHLVWNQQCKDPGSENYGSIETTKKTIRTLSDHNPPIRVRKTRHGTYPGIARITPGHIGLGPYSGDEEEDERDDPREEHGGHRDEDSTERDKDREEGAKVVFTECQLLSCCLRGSLGGAVRGRWRRNNDLSFRGLCQAGL